MDDWCDECGTQTAYIDPETRLCDVCAELAEHDGGVRDPEISF